MVEEAHLSASAVDTARSFGRVSLAISLGLEPHAVAYTHEAVLVEQELRMSFGAVSSGSDIPHCLLAQGPCARLRGLTSLLLQR